MSTQLSLSPTTAAPTFSVRYWLSSTLYASPPLVSVWPAESSLRSGLSCAWRRHAASTAMPVVCPPWPTTAGSPAKSGRSTAESWWKCASSVSIRRVRRGASCSVCICAVERLNDAVRLPRRIVKSAIEGSLGVVGVLPVTLGKVGEHEHASALDDAVVARLAVSVGRSFLRGSVRERDLVAHVRDRLAVQIEQPERDPGVFLFGRDEVAQERAVAHRFGRAGDGPASRGSPERELTGRPRELTARPSDE